MGDVPYLLQVTNYHLSTHPIDPPITQSRAHILSLPHDPPTSTTVSFPPYPITSLPFPPLPRNLRPRSLPMAWRPSTILNYSAPR